MATVPFTFVPPGVEGLVALHIYEAPAADGPYVEIEVVNTIGTYPGYIDHHTTTEAVSATDWFTLKWEDADGALSDPTVAIQGGTTTLVADVIRRVRERDVSLSLQVVQQEVEAAIQDVLGGDVDPYDPDLDPSYKVRNGLAYLALARCYLFLEAQGGQGESVSIGLISLRSSSTTGKNAERLLDLANSLLGINTSVVLQMRDIRHRHHWVEVFEP